MKIKLLCIACIAVFYAMAAPGAQAYARDIVPAKKPAANNIAVSMQIHNYSLRKNSIRLSPHPTANSGLTVTCKRNGNLFFYVFDLEGTLLHQLAFRGKEKKTITNLKKGVYTYDVFENNEGIEQGKIIVN